MCTPGKWIGYEYAYNRPGMKPYIAPRIFAPREAIDELTRGERRLPCRNQVEGYDWMFHDLVGTTCPSDVHWQHRAFCAAVVLLEHLKVKKIMRYGSVHSRLDPHGEIERWCGLRGVTLEVYSEDAVLA